MSRTLLLYLVLVLLAWTTPLPAQAPAPARALPFASAPAPSFPDALPAEGTEYRLGGGAGLWPKDPAVGGLLGAVIGCASGAVLAYLFSSSDRRTKDLGAACLLAGAVGMGAGSGWRVPGEDYFRPR